MIERNISRRDLYAMGEPLGDGATFRKPCGGLVCGIGGSSRSSASSTTNNNDNRVAVQGGAGLSNSDGNTVNITDGGMVSRALDTVELSNATVYGTTSRALDSIDLSGKRLETGYQSLIDAATSVFNEGQSLIGQTQKSVADAYGQAQTDKAGGIDQKTIIVLAIAGAVGLWAIKKA